MNFIDEATKARNCLEDTYNIGEKYTICVWFPTDLQVLGCTRRDNLFSYAIYINKTTASLETVHHEFAHVVELILRENSTHNNDFNNTLNTIKKYCEEN